MSRTYAVVGVLVLLLGVGGTYALYAHRDDRPSLDRFAADLKGKEPEEQTAIAERYLAVFSAPELNRALEAAYPLAACHEQGHPLGRAVYKETGTLGGAIAQCGTGCNQGCFHGAMMQMFSTDSDTLGGVIEEEDPASYMAHVREVATHLCERPDVASVMQTNFCIHGVGHVFEYINGYKLSDGLEACRIFKISGPCAAGVFMEYTKNPAFAEEFRKTDPTFCAPFKTTATMCYRYMTMHWIARTGSARAVIEECRSLDHTRALQCIWGVGFSVTTPDKLATDTGIDAYCGNLSADEEAACIRGAVAKVYDNDSSGTMDACLALAPRFRAMCTAGLTEAQSIKL